MTFWRKCLQCFGRVWHFWRGACSVLEGCGIFGGVLAMFWRDVAFWRGACNVLEDGGACSVLRGVAFWRGACSVLEGVAFWRCLQCFGGVWHFGGVLAVF